MVTWACYHTLRMATPKKELEKSVQGRIMAYVRNMGGWAVKVQPGTLYDLYGNVAQNVAKGTSDVIACVPGTHEIVFVEVKKVGGMLSPEQALFLKGHDEAGRRWVVAESVADVESHFRHRGYHGRDRYVAKVMGAEEEERGPNITTLIYGTL